MNKGAAFGPPLYFFVAPRVVLLCRPLVSSPRVVLLYRPLISVPKFCRTRRTPAAHPPHTRCTSLRLRRALAAPPSIPRPRPGPIPSGQDLAHFSSVPQNKKQDSEKSCFYRVKDRRTAVSPEIPPGPAVRGSSSSRPPAVSRRPRTGSDSPGCCRRYRGPRESSATKSSVAATGFR